MPKGAKSAKAGGGPGTTTAGQVKSTLVPAFGKRGKGRSMKRGGRSR